MGAVDNFVRLSLSSLTQRLPSLPPTSSSLLICSAASSDASAGAGAGAGSKTPTADTGADSPRKPQAYLGLGSSTYDGRHSEGNRFIVDRDL
jgi:hypothetical protein